MKLLSRIGIDGYMLLLVLTGTLGVVLPARGIAAEVLGDVTYWAVTLLFFLYGAKLDPASVRQGMLNLKLQGLTFLCTYLLFPIVGVILVTAFGGVLGPEMAMGILFLSVLPSTVQSSIAFTSIAGGNVPAAICAASLSNLIGVLLTPLLVGKLLHLDGSSSISFEAVEKIGIQILLPFVLGQLMRPLVGGFVKRHRVLTMVVDRGSILLIVFSAFSASTTSGLWAEIPARSMVLSFGVVVIFLAVIMASTSLIARLSGMVRADEIVLFFCGSKKSLASGLPVATAIFPAATLGATVLPVMMYHMLQLLVCSFIAQKLARRVAAPAA